MLHLHKVTIAIPCVLVCLFPVPLGLVDPTSIVMAILCLTFTASEFDK